MARPTLHRPIDNPLQLDKLPPTRPKMVWPVRTHSPREDQKHTLRMLLHLLVLGLVTLIAYTFVPDIVWDLDRAGPQLFLAGILIFCAVQLGAPPSLVYHAGLLIALVILLRDHLSWAAVVAVPLLLFVSFAFRRHYQYLAAASPLDPKQAREFRSRGRLPGQLRPARLWPAFWGAIVSWFSYNRDGCRAAGIFHSPAGSYRVRMFLSGTLVSLLALATPPLLPLTGSLVLHERTAMLSVPYYVLLSLVPALVPLVAFLLLGASHVRAAHVLLQNVSLAENWLPFDRSIRTSADQRERKSLFLGRVYHDGSPVLLPIETLCRHLWLVGSTGSGKTTYLLFLLEQLIARGWSVVYIDLKATDNSVLETFCRVQRRTTPPQPLKYLTNRQGLATHLFCLFTQSWWPNLSSTQKTDVLLAGMGLTFSRSYGESYFTDAAYAVLDHVNHKYPEIRNFQQLAQRLAYELHSAKDHELSSSTRRDGEHVRLVIDRLAQSDLFNPGSQHPKTALDGAVDLATLFTQPGLVYCGFSSLLAPTTSPENARVTVSALLTAATTTSRSTPVLLVIDEFQQMVAPGTLQLLLRQSRSLGISVILTNQTVDDLKAGRFDLTSTVEGNTSTQAWFKVTDRLGIGQLNHLAGQVVDTLRAATYTTTSDGTRTSVTLKQILIDRLVANDIVEAASIQDAFFLRITDGRDYAQYAAYPFLARSTYHLTRTEYERRMAAAWPAAAAQTIVVGASPPPTTPAPPQPNLPPLIPGLSPVINTGLVRPAKQTTRRLT